MKKAFGNVVRVFIVIDMFMMASMIAHPHEDRILPRRGAENEREQSHRQLGPESCVRKQPMITERDAESGRRQQHCEHGEMEPINAEMP